jgi:subtilisin family serine protease
LANVDRDEAHGTFIGGLLVAGQSLNSIELAPERDGCNLVDVDILPRDSAFATYYPGGVIEFFDEMENAVRTCRARYGIRIFNLSINLETPANIDSYSPFASHLDAIADETGAIIVISAGNLVDPNQRAEWPADPASALAILAAHRDDQVFMPSESLRNVSVSALNPPGLSGSISHAPARYSRRGPGLRSGFKPDLCHVGGSGTDSGPLETGLFSVSPTGALVSGCGTSYSAPLVARTLASLDASIEGQVERETLIALAVHGAITPEPLRHKVLQQVARHLAGFGRPAASGDLLERGDNEITLVFHARLVPDKKLCFDFSWPPSLVRSGGKCSGDAQVTLVARPPLKAAFGSETARVNVEASLQQDNGAGKFSNRLKPAYLEFAGDKGAHEIELIEHGFKWSPVKQYRRRMTGLGKSSNWRLCIDYLTRAGEALPAEGVPFTAVLTIAGSESNRNVFPEMQQILSRLGTRIADIRTAARIMPRV